MGLDRKIVLLGRTHITVASQLLDYVDRELARPVGNTGPPNVMERVGAAGRPTA